MLCSPHATRSARRTALLETALLALAAACWTPSCSDDGAGGEKACEGDSAVDARADLALSDDVGPVKDKYVIDALGLPGGSKTMHFTLRNVANLLSARPLSITSVTLSETDAAGTDDGVKTFSCVGPGDKSCEEASFAPVVPEGWLAQAACPPEGAKTSEAFSIRYTHDPKAGARRLKVAVHTTGDPDWQDEALIITIDTQLGSPRMECARYLVDFGLLKAGASKVETLKCFNTGAAELVVEKVEVLSNTNPPLTVSFSGVKATLQTPYAGSPPVKVPASASLDFTFALENVPDDKKLGATVRVHTNDPKDPVRSVLLQANSSGPCYMIHPSPVDFGEVPVGQDVPREVYLSPCGSEKVPIVSIALGPKTGQDFSLDFSTASFPAEQHKTGPTTEAPLEIVPGGVPQTFRVRCHPQQVGSGLSEGAVVITDDKGQSKEIPLRCQPFESAKPVACIRLLTAGAEIAPGQTVIPQTPLVLNADCSTAPTGQKIAKYQWQQPPQQPAGSVGLVQPNPLANPATFTPNVAGKYTFCLTVYDDGGDSSDLVCRDLLVVPDNKLHIELVWTQAGDKDKSDDKGADLDLHLAHPLAPKVASQNAQTGAYSKQPDADGNGTPDPWFAQCYDCFWLNCKGASPDWPANGEPKDDPRVDLDDTDGWGPENLSIETPQENAWYHVGVYAWDDAKMGPAVPTVRVFLDKKLVKVITGPPMGSGDMWCAARVLWNPTSSDPAADVIGCEGASPGKPLLTPSYPNPAKDPVAFNLKCPPTVGP